MKKKLFSVLLALVLVLSFSLVTAVPVAAVPADGDITIVVLDQAGNPIEGATATLLFYVTGADSMEGKSTETDGSAIFTGIEIATFLLGYDPTVQIYAQPGAKVETDSAYGKVRTVDPEDGFPCIPYNVPGETLVPKPAMSFTYNMILMSTEPVQTVWDDPTNNFTVTATLADSLSVTPDETQMRLIRNLVGEQPPAAGGSDDDWYMWNGTAYERWIGIATVNATATGASVSAIFSQDILSDWEDGNKIVVRPEFGYNRTVDGVPCIDDYYAVDSMRPSSYIHRVQIDGSDLFYPTIQDAIDAAIADDTILVAAGIYDGFSVNGKDLTISGIGDPVISGTTVTVASTNTLIGVQDATVTIEGLIVDATDIVTTPFAAILYRASIGGTIQDNTIQNIGDLGQDAGAIWVHSPTSIAILGNTINEFNKSGILVKDADSVMIEGNIISTTNYNLAPNGIQIGIDWETATTGTIKSNQVSGCSWKDYDPGRTYEDPEEPLNWTGSGILVIAPYSILEISGNEVHSCDVGLDIEAGSGTLIKNNDIHDNSYGIVSWNNNPTINFNDIYQNALGGVYRTYNFDGMLDACVNWWGDISGPEHEVSFAGWPEITGPANPGGIGDKVSDKVQYIPWLTREFETVLADEIAYFGIPMVYLNTGWNTFSTPVALDPACDTWAKYVALGDGLNINGPAYAFVGETQRWLPLIGEDAINYELEPCDAIYVRMAEPDIAAILYSPDVSVPSKDLYAGWNLVGLAYDPVDPEDISMLVCEALETVYTVTGDLTGWSLVVNPPVNWWPGHDWSHCWRPEGLVPPDSMLITNGYWVFMINPGTLAGFSFTPIPLPEPPLNGPS